MFAAERLPDLIEKLQKRPRTTLALVWAGMLSILIGALALLLSVGMAAAIRGAMRRRHPSPLPRRGLMAGSVKG